MHFKISEWLMKSTWTCSRALRFCIAMFSKATNWSFLNEFKNYELWMVIDVKHGQGMRKIDVYNWKLWNMNFLGSFWSCKNHNFKEKILFMPCPPTDLPTFNLIAMSVLLLELCFHFIYSEVICNSKWVFFLRLVEDLNSRQKQQQ